MHPLDTNGGDQHRTGGLQELSRAGIQSLDIALRTLRVLVDAGRPLSLKEFSARCRMSPSKLHRYLQSFVSAGMMTQMRRAGDYDLGNFALEVGLAAIQRIDQVNSVADRLPELAIQTGAPVSMSIWSAQGPTIVRWEKGSQPINTAFSVGSLLPLLSSATGNVFLAYLPASVTADLVAAETAMCDETKSIETIVAEVQHQGYAIMRGRFIPGLTGISAPVLNAYSQLLGAVTILTRTNQPNEQRLVEQLLTFVRNGSLGKTEHHNHASELSLRMKQHYLPCALFCVEMLGYFG
jgi:DNA-binding IclR family transcriptional regulator